MIDRPFYFNKLKTYKDNEQIKVISGVRRSGKSSLLLLWQEFLHENEKNAEIIYLNFEHPDTFYLHEGAELYNYLKTKVTAKRVYFLFDEIQLVNDWQRYVNGLRVAFDCDIYLSGSNSELLSGELATLLSGRYVEIPVYPLSFVEYLVFRNYKESESKDPYFRDYLSNGGFPLPTLTNSTFARTGIMKGIYDSILLRDVAQRSGVQDTALLERIVAFLMDNIGHPVSANNISNYLTSTGFKTFVSTISKYLALLEQAFVFYKAERYDIRGKERLKTLGKYYAVDLGLRHHVLGRADIDRGSQIENLVYLKLAQEGYKVFVGKYDDFEIDFVCFRDQSVKYIQVCEQLPKDSGRETENLLKIRDNYDRLVVTMNTLDVGVKDGIEIIHIYDFLLNDI